MIKYFKQAFTITNNNIILTTPLLLFLLIISLYVGITARIPHSFLISLLLLITILFMSAAFLAGWFFMVQKSVDINYKDIESTEKIKESLSIFKTFTTGVGEYFFAFINFSILFIFLIILFYTCGKYIGTHFIGHINLNITPDEIRSYMGASNQQIAEFLKTLPVEEIIKINKWNFLLLAFISLFSFITIFWPSAIINTSKNPIIAFFKSLKFIFKNFFEVIVLYLYITILNLLISTLNGFASTNNFLFFITTLIYFYFITYAIVLIFLYYDKGKYEEIKNNSDCGTDSIGQE